ncbi:MAG TPA: hypothetical protein VGC74_12105 [Stenotrophomonas sp.]|jgi:hypothetical protein
MPIESIPGTDLRYYLLSLDEDGDERKNDPDGLMSQRIAEAISSGEVTDVFLFIHGWKGDLPAARRQYAAWMSALMGQAGDLARADALRPGFTPLLVGLHWPSLPFGEESMASGVAFGLETGDAALASAIDRAAQQVADSPAARAALRIIFEAARDIEFTPTSLPDEVAEAYRILNVESGLGADDREADPAADRLPFDSQAAYARSKSDAASFGGGGGGARKALLSPLVQLSFWKMKARAKRVGEKGGFALLSALMRASNPQVRFHLMGHSFGCVAVSASACGPAQATLPRPVSSVVLVQGALSLWSCSERLPDSSKPGYFRRLATPAVVSGPIVTTRSRHDMAVGSLYPLAAGVARQVEFAVGQLPTYGGVGTFGLRGDGLAIEDLDVQEADFRYDLAPGRIYNVDCNRVICEGGPPSGAHSDIARPQVAHLVWAAALA